MKYTPDLAAKITAVLEERGVPKECPMCGTKNWTLIDGFAFISIMDSFPGARVGGRGAPCACLTCRNCGNTALMNLLMLGFTDIMKEEA